VSGCLFLSFQADFDFITTKNDSTRLARTSVATCSISAWPGTKSNGTRNLPRVSPRQNLATSTWAVMPRFKQTNYPPKLNILPQPRQPRRDQLQQRCSHPSLHVPHPCRSPDSFPHACHRKRHSPLPQPYPHPPQHPQQLPPQRLPPQQRPNLQGIRSVHPGHPRRLRHCRLEQRHLRCPRWPRRRCLDACLRGPSLSKLRPRTLLRRSPQQRQLLHGTGLLRPRT